MPVDLQASRVVGFDLMNERRRNRRLDAELGHAPIDKVGVPDLELPFVALDHVYKAVTVGRGSRLILLDRLRPHLREQLSDVSVLGLAAQ